MDKKCVFLVDDNKNFLESAINFLTTDEHFSVVGWAFNASDAIDKIRKFGPDLVLLDFSLPDMNGFEVTRILKKLPDPPVVIIVSIHDHENYIFEADNCGADAYVSKSEFGSRIIPLIEDILNK